MHRIVSYYIVTYIIRYDEGLENWKRGCICAHVDTEWLLSCVFAVTQ